MIKYVESNIGVYILRRLLLMIRTLLGIMLISFDIVQFVPSGLIQRITTHLINIFTKRKERKI